MSAIRDSARVLRWSATSALADLRAFYTWKTWLFGWLTRILCQVAFFALIGAMLDSPDRTAYLLVGNAVFVGSPPRCSCAPQAAGSGWRAPSPS